MESVQRRRSARLERRGSSAPYVAGAGVKVALILSPDKKSRQAELSAASGSGARAALALQPAKSAAEKGKRKASTSCSENISEPASANSGLTSYMGALAWEEPSTAGSSQMQPSPTKAASSKYPKKDVLALREYFDQFDQDQNGHISLAELKDVLLKQKVAVQRDDGLEHSLDERNRKASYLTCQHNGHRREGTTAAFLDSLAESLFAALDRNHDGRATFRELLTLMFPRATLPELETMCRWVAPKPRAAAARSLSAEQEAEVRSIFRMYDRDHSGDLSVSELLAALGSTGLTQEEVEQLHASADADGDGAVDFAEFRQLMLSSGLYDDDGALADRVAISRVANDAARARRSQQVVSKSRAPRPRK